MAISQKEVSPGLPSHVAFGHNSQAVARFLNRGETEHLPKSARQKMADKPSRLAAGKP